MYPASVMLLGLNHCAFSVHCFLFHQQSSMITYKLSALIEMLVQVEFSQTFIGEQLLICQLVYFNGISHC